MTLAELNGADRAKFTAAIGHLFEHSPWVAWIRGPEALQGSRALLHAELCCRRCTGHRPAACAHPGCPDPPVALALAENSTLESTREQVSAGLDSGNRGIGRLQKQGRNAEYRHCFGFPFIICARLITEEREFWPLCCEPGIQRRRRRRPFQKSKKIAWLRHRTSQTSLSWLEHARKTQHQCWTPPRVPAAGMRSGCMHGPQVPPL